MNNDSEKSKNIFNVLSFERKLVELVEELRLRRNLEIESEKTLKSVMDEKYKQELCWEEQQRRYSREKDDLEQQMSILKRKLDDKVCVSDDDKAKQQIINRTYSHEIRMLKEELRTSKSEKLNLQKKVQELEGKLNLHNKFQESIITQVTDARKAIKSILEEAQQLTAAQKNVMENVAAAKLSFKKYDLCNQHLQQSMKIIGTKSEALKKDLILCRSELILLKHSVPTQQETPNNNIEVEKLQKKILDLENLLLSSRKENEKTLSNFMESNKLLCKFMDNHSETQEREKQLILDVEWAREKFKETERKLHETLDEMKKNEELAALKEKERVENRRFAETQTEASMSNECCSHSDMQKPLNADLLLADFHSVRESTQADFSEAMRNGPMNLEQNAVVRQAEMYINNGFRNFSVDPKLPHLSGDRKITISEVLKRKLEVVGSGDTIELISMKRRFTKSPPSTFRANGSEMNETSALPSSSPKTRDTSRLCIDSEPRKKMIVPIPVDGKYLGSPEGAPTTKLDEKELENESLCKQEMLRH